MADAVSNFIAAVHVELAKAELHGSAVPNKVGAKRWGEHSCHPLIKWKRGDISHAATKGTSGSSPTIYTRNQTLILMIWTADEESCEVLLDNVIRAARIAAGGSDNLRPGRFVWATEDHSGWENKGAALIGDLTVDLQIAESATPPVMVTIGTQTHTITLGQP